VAWDFDHVGQIDADRGEHRATQASPPSRNRGARREPDDEEGTTRFITDPADLDLVSRALPRRDFTRDSSPAGPRTRWTQPAWVNIEGVERPVVVGRQRRRAARTPAWRAGACAHSTLTHISMCLRPALW
jgi:hypothetical protein